VWGDSKLPKNVTVAKAVEVEWFWRVMVDAIVVANKASPINAP
jgi:hypothetical protein